MVQPLGEIKYFQNFNHEDESRWHMIFLQINSTLKNVLFP